MKATARHARATIRRISRETRTHRRAQRNIATSTPQTAKTHLIASGVPVDTATRFVGAFSRSVIPTATTTVKIKLKKRHRATVTVKLYDQATFRARLAVYRPKDQQAATVFARAAA
jgi:hypothetical protein